MTRQSIRLRLSHNLTRGLPQVIRSTNLLVRVLVRVRLRRRTAHSDSPAMRVIRPDALFLRQEDSRVAIDDRSENGDSSDAFLGRHRHGDGPERGRKTGGWAGNDEGAVWERES